MLRSVSTCRSFARRKRSDISIACYTLCGMSITSEYRGLELSCFENPTDGFYLVEDADLFWREFELESRQRHHVFGRRLVGCHILEMLLFSPSGRHDCLTPVPHGWDHDSNCFLEISAPEIFLYMADDLHMLISKDQNQMGRIVEVMLELETIGAFLQTDRNEAVRRLLPNDATRVCCGGGVFIEFLGYNPKVV